MTGPSGCCDPATRAATLLATPYSLQLSVPGLPSRPCPIGAVVGTALFTLVRPGAVADAVREAPGDATLAAVARSVAGDGSTPVHAGLEVLGTVRRVPQGRRSAAALALHDNLACDDLLDAVVDDRWLLAEIEPFAVTWHLAQASVPLDPVDLAHAQVDEVLRHSTRLCPRLNSDHPQIAAAIAGRPAWFIEVDRSGASLGLHDRAGHIARANWHRPCEDLDDLHVAIAHSPLPRAGTPAGVPAHRRPS
jgi:hypothetical protein